MQRKKNPIIEKSFYINVSANGNLFNDTVIDS